MMSRYGTNMYETEALLAAMAHDPKALNEIISNMNAMEQRELARACERLKNELWYRLTTKGVEDERDTGRI